MVLLNKIQNNSFLRASSIVFIGTMFVNVANYAFNLALGRLLSPAEYGEVAALVTLSMLIAVPAGTLTSVMSKFAAHHDSKQQHKESKVLFDRFTRLSLLTSLGVLVLLLLLSPSIARFFHTPLLPVLIFAGVLPMSLIVAVNSGTLQGIKHFNQYVSISIISTTAKLILAVVFVLLGFSVPGVMAAILIGVMLSYLYSYIKVRHYYKDHSRQIDSASTLQQDESDISAENKTPIKVSSYVFLSFWTVLALSILTNVDVILAKHFLSAQLAGQYAALSVVGRIITYGSLAVVAVLFPSVAAAKSQNNGEEHRLLAMGFGIVFALAAGLVAVFNIAPQLVVSLLFGQAYDFIVPYLSLFSVFMGLLALSHVLVQYFLATHNRIFVYPLVVIAIGEIIALWRYHASIDQIIQVLLTTVSILLASLIVVYFATKTKIPIRQVSK